MIYSTEEQKETEISLDLIINTGLQLVIYYIIKLGLEAMVALNGFTKLQDF